MPPSEIAKAMGRLNGSTNSCVASVAQAAGVAALEVLRSASEKCGRIFAKSKQAILEELSEISVLSCDPHKGAFYASVNEDKTGVD